MSVAEPSKTKASFYQAQFRKRLSGERLKAYREKARQRQREWWASLPPEEKAKQGEYKRLWAATKRTPEQKEKAKAARRQRYLKSLTNLTEGQIAARREKDRLAKASFRKRMTEEQKEKRRDYFRARRQDPQFRLGINLRVRLWAAIKNQAKRGSAVKDLGCSISEFMQYIAVRFSAEMSWDNWGDVWELDHILPVSLFDLTDREQLLRACHYSNYQPLLSLENARKSDFVQLDDGSLVRVGRRRKSVS